MRCVVVLVVATAVVQARGPFRKMFPDHGDLTVPSSSWESVGKPLFLTPLLEAGKIKEARSLSRVSLGHRYGHSFSGFLTVNKKYDSNLFFWFFPARVRADNAPVMVWLQGGPGGSSLFGLFAEHGPFNVDASLHIVPRNTSWTKNHNVIYIDNPAGTGFSFTRDDAGYARNQTDVGRDLYAAILQFFMLFPELQRNDFFVTGESYAGKYVPALTYTIHKENPTAKLKINLKGMAIGDGLCDPVTMTDYGDFLYNIGLIDDNVLLYFKQQSELAVSYIQQHQWLKAFEVFDSLLNGDKTGYPSYFTNVTGLSYYFNYVANGEPQDMEYWTKYINKPTVRRSIHVGNLTFNDGSAVETHLEEDIMKSVKPWIEELLDNYSVLIYNGQLDVIIAYTLTENFLNSLQWKNAAEFKQSSRLIWRVDGKVAGYVREVPGLIQVMVRNAGHMVPYDQPLWAFDMISRFTSVKSFSSH
ncbi:probable serine carboxypeptidase CPVL [Homarus americanus]|uniref:Carboxypeptidase n=1 Tax=Homarus americanus TaxID=6706 RepID=A0A8J5JC73_HOMAM|nr:probable serine carboxypeptidase CPVL [Homarus americanus]XP_042208172.1 probable serine carboxypeptidase CPVL [Homarus americanus]XP_042208173.1 probable serine carboxypeptidase CPVL [Homarus americanus]XP_042208174.1 probable serine carboxypeptidase CPVL [Homarus americanus]KAG7154151.1 serine carboxypeptidase CPVL-like [Homarus americanus]